MPRQLDETHDPHAKSWLSSANEATTDFPIQNLPFGVFRRDRSDRPRVGTAIGDQVLDVGSLASAGLAEGEAATAAEACRATSLNPLLALGAAHWSALRRAIAALLRAGVPHESTHRAAAGQYLLPIASVDLLVPATIGDYTDFYASIFHATNVGRMLRPHEPLLPNYKWVPIGYHGRASSIVVSGTPIRRPFGQTRAQGAAQPVFGPSRKLDYELEVGAYIGPGNDLGRPIPVQDADSHVFGLCLVNDWSARDVQAWEYQPLGPFLAKSFATTVSPWVVTLDALEPYRVALPSRPEGDPQPLPYLVGDGDRSRVAHPLTLDVYLQTARMREKHVEPVRLSRGHFHEDMYWTIAQLVAHHTSNGCNLRPGDLLASGTVSGSERDSRGCLLELSWRGEEAVVIGDGEARTFLDDGDEIVFRGVCERPGRPAIGFGECRGRIVPAE